MIEPSQLFSNQRGRLPAKMAVRLADLILKSEKYKLSVNIIFADDPCLRRLNHEFRDQRKPTDVLSFVSDPELGILGEIYISIDTARRQAKKYGTTLTDEILRLVCHGTLHLCGYRHKKKPEARRMEMKTEHYLDRFRHYD